MKNYYEILGLGKNASTDDVKRAYRKKAMLYHPDKNGDHNANELFIEVSEAYEILSNENNRKQYDQLYEPNFTSSSVPIHGTKQNDFDQIVNESRMKAEAYAKLKLNELLDKLGFVVGETVKASVNLSTLLFSCVFFFGGIGGFYNWLMALLDGTLGVFEIVIGPILTLGFALAGFVSLKDMAKDLLN